MAKKKIKDLTLNECKEICNKSGNEFNSCAKCPLTSICLMYQDTNFDIPNNFLDEEIEVE